MSKGDKRRPRMVGREDFASRWADTFDATPVDALVYATPGQRKELLGEHARHHVEARYGSLICRPCGVSVAPVECAIDLGVPV